MSNEQVRKIVEILELTQAAMRSMSKDQEAILQRVEALEKKIQEWEAADNAAQERIKKARG